MTSAQQKEGEYTQRIRFLILLEFHGYIFMVALYKFMFEFHSLASHKTADVYAWPGLLSRGTIFLVFAFLNRCQDQVRPDEPN